MASPTEMRKTVNEKPIPVMMCLHLLKNTRVMFPKMLKIYIESLKPYRGRPRESQISNMNLLNKLMLDNW